MKRAEEKVMLAEKKLKKAERGEPEAGRRKLKVQELGLLRKLELGTRVGT